MRNVRTVSLLAAVLAAVLLAAPNPAQANEELLVMQGNPAEWVMPTGDYANTRYSSLSQINKGNVGKLQTAWT
ncbi:MAG: PQQ-dependent dehydrogenase, methanol/ethanol family, partial [Alphaproteobacteria bacterium]